MAPYYRRCAALVALLISYTGRTVAAPERQAGLCSWSPLVPIADPATRIINREPGDSSGSGYANYNSSDWRGPHACAGSYCVYSNPGFNSGQGVVFITTPKNAEQISRLAVFSQSSSFEAPTTGSSLFRMAEIPDKGLGLVATQSIRRGQQIMSHFPAVVVHRKLVDQLPDADKFRLFDAGVAQLPSFTREAFLKQMGHAGGHPVDDIMNTNSFQMHLPIPDSAHFANFISVSRFNHDCRPNVVYYTDGTLRHTTHAVRDIRPGEELTISYVDSFRVHQVRRDRTLRSWGFSCSCPHCSMSAALTNASDNRLWRIYEIEQILARPSAPVDEDTIELLLSMYAQERLLESHGAYAYSLVALYYSSIRREALATKFALLALEQGLLEEGVGWSDVRAMVELLENPRSHVSWGRRMGS